MPGPDRDLGFNLPPEVLKQVMERREEFLDSAGLLDRDRIIAFVKKIPKATRLEIFEGTEELSRRRAEESSRYYVPLAKEDGSQQLEFHQCDRQFRVILGGNQGGKTEALVQELNYWATGTHPWLKTRTPPIYGRCVGTSWSAVVTNIIPKFMQVVRRDQLKGGKWETAFRGSISHPTSGMALDYANGSVIDFLNYEQKPIEFAGVQRDIIGFDEEPPKDIYDESLPRLLMYNGRIVIAMTAVNGYTWIGEELVDSPSPDVAVFVLPTLSNKHLDQKAKDMLVRRYANDPEMAAVRLYGQMIQIGGLLFKTWRDNLHICAEFVIPQWWPKAILIDPGLSKGHAAVWGAVDPKTLHLGEYPKSYFFDELLGDEGESVDEFCRKLRDHNKGRFIEHFRIDPHWDWENKAVQDGFNLFREFEKHIPGLQPAPENWKGSYYEAYKNRLVLDPMGRSDGMPWENNHVGVQWFADSCPKFIKQMKSFSYVKQKDIQKLQSDKKKVRNVNDDLIDCGGMLLTDSISTWRNPNAYKQPDLVFDSLTGRVIG